MTTSCALLEKYPDLLFKIQFSEGSLACAEKEGSFTLKKTDLSSVEIFYIYGLCQGLPYRALKEWLEEKRERRLVFIEEELSWIAHLLSQECAQELLSHPQVVLHHLESDAELEELVARFPTQRIQVQAASSQNTERFSEIELQILRLSGVAHALMAEALHAHRLRPNLLRNMRHWSSCFLAAGLKGKFQNVPAIICGAGPSLQKNSAFLKELEDRALILAGGSAIAALTHQGIIPHLGFALDPNPEEYERLKVASCYEMPLLFATRLQPDVLEVLNGEFGYLHSDTGGPCERHFEEVLGIAQEAIGPQLGQEALSVTTLAVAFAVEMGCNPILLNGVDLAYVDQKRYAEGIVADSKIDVEILSEKNEALDRLLVRENAKGERVFTLVKWVMESDCISAFAALHPDRRFYNLSQEGIGFSEIPTLTCDEVLEKESLDPRDLRALVHAEIQELKISIDSRRYSEELLTLRESLGRLKMLAEEMLQELSHLKEHPPHIFPTAKMTLLSLDFEEEKAFSALLPHVGVALDRLLERTYFSPSEASEEEKLKMQIERQLAKWKQIEEIVAVDLENFSK